MLTSAPRIAPARQSPVTKAVEMGKTVRLRTLWLRGRCFHRFGSTLMLRSASVANCSSSCFTTPASMSGYEDRGLAGTSALPRPACGGIILAVIGPAPVFLGLRSEPTDGF